MASGPLHLNVELEESFDPGDGDFSGLTTNAFAPAKDRLDVAALARWLREDLYRGIVVLIGGLEPDDTGGGVPFLPGFRRAGGRRGHQRAARGAPGARHS